MSRSIERHYDSLALLYRFFWGLHIHHGLWPEGPSPTPIAQERLVAHLADRAEIKHDETVLDVGCGYGASGRWLSEHIGCRVTGITISRRQARLAGRFNRRRSQLEGIHVVRADAAQLPIGRSAIDVVWVVECVEHLSDKRGFVHEVARTLRPGGRLALCTWQRREGAAADGALVQQVCQAFLCPSLSTPSEVGGWCVEAGLEVLTSEDLTAQVSATWDILIRRVRRPWLQPLRLLMGRDVRRFVDGFPKIAAAYASGAMSYGLLVAIKSA